MTGKQKCNLLRRIRRDIAAANHLNYTERDCTHTGPCAGTCPYCEAQLRRLEEKLEERRSLGQRIAVAGLSMGLIVSNLTACDPFTKTVDGLMPLQGDVTAPETEQTETCTTTAGEILAETTQTESVWTEKGLIAPLETEALMGDPVIEMGEVTIPETEVMGTVPAPETIAAPETFPGPTAGVPMMPELPEPETEPLLAGGIPPVAELPEPGPVQP